jgi:hypothetical protein
VKEPACRLEEMRIEAWREAARYGRQLAAGVGDTSAAFVRRHPWVTLIGASAFAAATVATTRAGVAVARKNSRIGSVIAWGVRTLVPSMLSSVARSHLRDEV